MAEDMSKNGPLVSILLPVYNSRRYIEECLNSILNQTYKNIEIIIINDGCNDGTEEILKTIAIEFRNIKLYNQENLGYCNSINKGIVYCSGEYIARMDADDIMISSRIERQVEHLEMYPEVSILGTSICYINSFGEELTKHIFPNRYKIPRQILDQSPVAHPSVMIRKSVFQKVGKFRSNLYPSEDYDFWLRASSLGFVIDNLDEILLLYRIHGNSTTHNNSIKRAYSSIAAQKAYLLRLINKDDHLEDYSFDFNDYFENLPDNIKPSKLEIFTSINNTISNSNIINTLSEYNKLYFNDKDAKYHVLFLLRVSYYYFSTKRYFHSLWFFIKAWRISYVKTFSLILNKLNEKGVL